MQFNDYEILKLMGDAQVYDAQAQAAQQAMNQNGWGGGIGALLGGIGGFLANKRQGQSTEAMTEAQNKLKLMEKSYAQWEQEQAAAAEQAKVANQIAALTPHYGEEGARAIVIGGVNPKDLQPDLTELQKNMADPMTRAYLENKAKNSGVTVNNNMGETKYGKIPEGFMMKETADGVQMVPVPGSPAEKEAMSLQSKAKMKGMGALQDAMNINTVIDQAIENADGWTTGFLGAGASLIPGTSAHDLSQNMKTIEADAAFSSLQQMRDNSVTGGALGQVSERELGLLSSAKAALSQSQSTEQFKANLERYKAVRNQALMNTAKAYQEDYGTQAPWMPQEQEKKQGGQIMVDANGNRAMVYPDGTFEEL